MRSPLTWLLPLTLTAACAPGSQQSGEVRSIPMRTTAASAAIPIFALEWPPQLGNAYLYYVMTISQQAGMACMKRNDSLQADAEHAAHTSRWLLLGAGVSAAAGAALTASAPVAYPKDTEARNDYLVATGIGTAGVTAVLAALGSFWNADTRSQQDSQRIGRIEAAVSDFTKAWTATVHDGAFGSDCDANPPIGSRIPPDENAAQVTAFFAHKDDMIYLQSGPGGVVPVFIRAADLLGAFLRTHDRCLLPETRQSELVGKLVTIVDALVQACVGQTDLGASPPPTPNGTPNQRPAAAPSAAPTGSARATSVGQLVASPPEGSP